MHEFSFKLKVCKIFGVKTLEIQEISKNLFNNYSLRFFNHRQPVLSEKKKQKSFEYIFSPDNYAPPFISNGAIRLLTFVKK